VRHRKCTIVRATQFFDRLSPALVQPVVSDDVAAALADVAVEEPLNGTVELAGPEPIRLDELVRRFLSSNRDPRKVITDVHARYFGTELNDQSLTPGDNPHRPDTFRGLAQPLLTAGGKPPGRVNAQIK
jgi:uncharacterized protein YbjT (DUF2867 family)